MENATSFLQEITGTTNYIAYAACWFFALTGVTISLLMHGLNKFQSAVNTPDKFKLSFLIIDNLKRIALNLLLLFVTMRFSNEMIGKGITYALAIIIGFCYDKLAQLFKKYTSLLDIDRDTINPS